MNTNWDISKQKNFNKKGTDGRPDGRKSQPLCLPSLTWVEKNEICVYLNKIFRNFHCELKFCHIRTSLECQNSMAFPGCSPLAVAFQLLQSSQSQRCSSWHSLCPSHHWQGTTPVVLVPVLTPTSLPRVWNALPASKHCAGSVYP